MEHPVDIFNERYKAAHDLLQAADTYAILKLDNIRGSSKGAEFVKKTISEGGISLMVASKYWTMTEKERIEFEKSGYVKQLANKLQLCLIHYLKNIWLISLNILFKKELKTKVLERQ